MNSSCKKKITTICQHFKLPLEQILHAALIQSHSHTGYTHSSKLNSARKASCIWHVIICTSKLLGQLLTSFWPGPTITLPNNLQPQLRRGNIAESVSKRMLAAGQVLWERRALTSREAGCPVLAGHSAQKHSQAPFAD